MKLTEIKNNFAKIMYRPAETKLVLSDFLTIDDDCKKICAQVVSIESTTLQSANQAVVKFCFNISDDGSLTAYNGYVPSVEAKVGVTDSSLIEKTFSSVNGSFCIGELTSSTNSVLNFKQDFSNKFLYVQSDRVSEINSIFKTMLNNLTDKNSVVFDLDGTIDIQSESTYEICKNFKLPINVETLDYIYEHDLPGLTIEQKAIVQDIIIEIQEYIRTETTGFIPFSTLLDVVEGIYQSDKSVGIILFRNKLLKYHQYRLFASKEEEFASVSNSININNLTVLKLQNIPENWRKEAMNYILGNTNLGVHFFASITDKTADGYVLDKLYAAQSTVVASPYISKFANHLKSLAKNLILFMPEELQKVYPTYNSFLSKLSSGEFIISGEDTLYTPLIVRKVSNPPEKEIPAINPEDIEVLSIASSVPQMDDLSKVFHDPVEQEIAQDVDSMFTSNGVEAADVDYEDMFSEEDLDFLDDINNGELPTSDVIDETIIPGGDEDVAVPVADLPNTEEHGMISEEIVEENDFLGDIVEPLQQVSQVSLQSDFSPIPEQDESLIEQDEHEDLELLPEDDEVEDLFANGDYSISNESIGFSGVQDAEEAADNISFVSDSPKSMSQNNSEKPSVPVYSTNMKDNSSGNFRLTEGNTVYHEKYGRGVVEQIISYGKKTLCSIQFDNIGRRLLDPKLADLKLM